MPRPASLAIGHTLAHEAKKEKYIRRYNLDPAYAFSLKRGTQVIVSMRDGTVYHGKYLEPWEVATVNPRGKPTMSPAIRLELSDRQQSIALHQIQHIRATDRSRADMLGFAAVLFLFSAYAELMVRLIALPANVACGLLTL